MSDLVRAANSRLFGEASHAVDDPFARMSVVEFLTTQMFIPETQGAMPLYPHQIAVLTAMFETDERGAFKYHTMIYSAIKKSAKTTIGAGIALWQAFRIPAGEIYIIGNDLKQADSRMAQALRYAISENPRLRDRVKVTPSKFKMVLDNGTRIEAIPVDPQGEAGMNPTGLFWTEAWGAKGTKAELLWTEAQLSPTPGRAEYSFRFIESYAGYTGEAPILEPLYTNIVRQGQPHPTAPETYTRGRMIAYWNTRPQLPWQTDQYYEDQAATLEPKEFRRIHRNEWVTSEDVFVPPEWWHACRGDLPPMGQWESWLIGVDAGVSNDCFAIVAVAVVDEWVVVRYFQKWEAPTNGKINFDEPEREIRRLCATYHVEQVAYDPYQLHDMATRLSVDMVGWVEPFQQGAARLKGDKQLYDLIRDRRLLHDGGPGLTEHVLNANAKKDGDDSKLRIVKRAAHLKIDGCVALAMAASRAIELGL